MVADRGLRNKAVTLLVGVLASLPPIIVASVVGVFETPDTGAYLAYAEMLLNGPLPKGDALLTSSYSPIPLYRTPGYPALIAILQYNFPAYWPWVLLGVQVFAQAMLAAYAHRVALVLGLHPILAVIVALMPSAGSVAVFQSAVMTDALFGALFGGAMLLLLRAALVPGGIAKLMVAGLMLGVGLLIREATLYLLLGLMPLAFLATRKGQRIIGFIAIMTPPLLAAGLIMADHYRRSGYAVLSTSKQVVMVQALLPLVARGVPAFEGETLFLTTAREVIVGSDYHSIHRLNARLFEAGMTAPEIAAAASDNYARAWRKYPIEMLQATATRLPVKMLWITFMPVDTAADVYRQTGEPRPWFGRSETLWQLAMQGSLSALPILLALWLGRAIGLAVTLGAIASPVLLARSDSRRAPVTCAWLATGAFVAVYLPVHLEQRYLIPIVPMLCLLGGLAFQEVYFAWRSRPSTKNGLSRIKLPLD
jgi:hypothetical protein